MCLCFFPFDVSDGRCGIIVSIPDHCLPFYFRPARACSPQQTPRGKLITPKKVGLAVKDIQQQTF